MKSSLPNAWKLMLSRLIYPPRPPEKRTRTVEAEGHTYDVTRQGEFVQVVADSLEAEAALRECFGQGENAEERGGVEGFMTTREEQSEHGTRVHLRIKRPTLIVESLGK